MQFPSPALPATAGILLTLGAAAPPRQGYGGVLEGAAVIGSVFVHVVAPRDTLTSIGARRGVSPAVIARGNGLAPHALLQVGQPILVDNRHVVPPRAAGETLVVNIPQRMLFAFTGDGAMAFPIAVGRRDWPTPLGRFTITEKEADPAWDVPESIRDELRRSGRPAPARVAPGPANPLGSYWLRTSFPGIGLHGTPQPSSIYRAATHGCIRLHPADIAQLFSRVPEGAAGHVLYEPVLAARTPTGVFLEAHPDLYRAWTGADVDGVRAWADAQGLSGALDWRAVVDVLAARDGVARLVGGQP